MNRVYGIVGIICSALLLVFVVYKHTGIKTQSHTLSVVCTTTMITDAVKRIGHPYVTVTGLMGPGVDPHLYRASARTVEQLASADIIMYHGLHLEGKIADTLHALGATQTTVAVTDGIDRKLLIASDFEGMYDPHVWHDVSLWIMVVQYIAQQLCIADPEHDSWYRDRAQEYKDELRKLDEYIHNQCLQLRDDERILVTAHDAFAYFGRRYGISVVALQGMNTDAQISPKDVSRLAGFIIDHNVSTIFVESSIPHRTMEAVFQAVQARGRTVVVGDELLSDSLGDVDAAWGTYCGMMRYNCDAIVRGLKH